MIGNIPVLHENFNLIKSARLLEACSRHLSIEKLNAYEFP